MTKPGEEIAARLAKLSKIDLHPMAFYMATLESDRQWPDGREGVRQRLLFAEKYLGNVSLRDERGKLRRGELQESDLSTLDELGLSAAWIMTGVYPASI